MKCILIFNALNDVVFAKYNKEFSDHINSYAKTQGLISEKKEDLSLNVIVQIFSPLITSHRVMNHEFRNTYESVECGEGIKLVFEEFMGHLFIVIGKDSILSLKVQQRISLALVKFICGVNIDRLRNDDQFSQLVGNLFESWENVSNIDQAMKVEAVEQLIINTDLSSVALEFLKVIVSSFKHHKVHALLTVQNKLLSLYSSHNAKELSSADMLLLIILFNAKNLPESSHLIYSESSSTLNDIYSSKSSISFDSSIQTNEIENIKSFYVFLSGYKADPSCVPHAVHLMPITDEIRLIVLVESPVLAPVCIAIYDTSQHLHFLQNLQNQRNIELMKPALHNLEVAVNILNNKLKNLKGAGQQQQQVEIDYKTIWSKWKVIKRTYDEVFKGDSDDAFLKSEIVLNNFGDTLKKLFEFVGFDYNLVAVTRKIAIKAGKSVYEKILPFCEMFEVKALKNFSLGSYLEDFPGLVHFIYIDRDSHRIVTPSLDISFNDEVNKEFKKDVWHMLEFCSSHLQEGILSLIWKNATFTFAYYLWFEDITGESIKPTIHPSEAVKKFSKVGIINGDFYYKLKQNCFPKTSPNKIRCYELYSVHLKIAAPALILDQMRKLTTTVWEMKGHSNMPLDLL